MTAHIYTEADAPIDPLKGKRIAVIGYGSQGHAHALNAHDSGLEAKIGDRVRVTETRPLSKLKRWRVTDVLERAR